MITDSFDNSEAIISPASFFGEQTKIVDTTVITFSREIFETVLNTYPNEKIEEFRSCNLIRPIHLIDVDGMKLGFYLSEVGSCLASTDVMEANWKIGSDKFILFGSCGALDPDKINGRYIIPTQAYRDDEKGLPFIKGKVWTTDALYRETRDLVKQRKDEGCIAVEMELAGVQAVCDYHGFELYDFLVAGDVVDQPDYTPEGLHEANHSLDKFDIAIEIAKRIKGE